MTVVAAKTHNGSTNGSASVGHVSHKLYVFSIFIYNCKPIEKINVKKLKIIIITKKLY